MMRGKYSNGVIWLNEQAVKNDADLNRLLEHEYAHHEFTLAHPKLAWLLKPMPAFALLAGFVAGRLLLPTSINWLAFALLFPSLWGLFHEVEVLLKTGEPRQAILRVVIVGLALVVITAAADHLLRQ